MAVLGITLVLADKQVRFAYIGGPNGPIVWTAWLRISFVMSSHPSIHHTCKNCQAEAHGLFCQVCGQQLLGPITNRMLLEDTFSNVVDVDRGFLHTVLRLAQRPNEVIRDWWEGKTVPYFHPIRFTILITAISTVIMLQTGVLADAYEGTNTATKQGSQVKAALDLIFSYFNVIMLLTVPIKAYVTTHLFRASKRNFAEFCYMHCYLYGQVLLFQLPGHFLMWLAFDGQHALAWRMVGQLMHAAYFVWASYGLLSNKLGTLAVRALLLSAAHILAIFVMIGLLVFGYVLVGHVV